MKMLEMTKLLKKTAIAAGVAGLCLAGVANATVLNPAGQSFGTLASPTTASYDGLETTPGATVFDVISFSMSNTAQSNTATIASAIGGWGWSSFVTSLWSTANTTGTRWALGSSVSDGNGAWHSTYDFAPLTSAGSPYFIHINGVTLTTSTSARYSGNMTLAPLAPVPEPEIYGMLAAGLGLMGFVARRRREREAA